MPGIENLNYRSSVSHWNRDADATGMLGARDGANIFCLNLATSVIRFSRPSLPAVSPKQSVDTHFNLIGCVAFSNGLRRECYHAFQNADLVTGLSLLNPRSSIQRDHVRPSVRCETRSFDPSITGSNLTAGKPLTLSSTRNSATRAKIRPMLALGMSSSQNNSLRSAVFPRHPDRSLRKTTQDEKRNVDQRLAIGRMPDCDR